MSSDVGLSNAGYDEGIWHTGKAEHNVTYSVNNNTTNKQVKDSKSQRYILGIMGLLIIGLIVAIIVVAIIFSPLLDDNKKNKDLITQLKNTMDKLKTDMEKVNQSCVVKTEDTETMVNTLKNDVSQVNVKYRQLEVNQLASSEALQALQNSTNATLTVLKDFQSSIDQNITELINVHKYTYAGLEYGRNSQGAVEEECHGTRAGFECLLLCYKSNQQNPAITALNIRREDFRCCCESNTDHSQRKMDEGFFHYVLKHN